MDERARFEIESVHQARAALEYFNGFHDGFARRIALTSQDRMEEDGSQTASGVFDVEIDFAHYNYARGGRPLQPPGQLVRGTFRAVQDIFLDLREGFLGNSIIRLSVVPVRRRAGGSTAAEDSLALWLARHFYLEEFRRHELRESQIFTFATATLVEL